MSKGPISQFIENNYLHFNSAALVDAELIDLVTPALFVAALATKTLQRWIQDELELEAKKKK
jgi:hypothetical protein